MVFARHQEEGFDIGRQFPIGQGHLEFVFEIAIGAQAAQNDPDSAFVAKIDQHSVHGFDGDIGQVLDDFPCHGDSFIAGEEGAGFPGGAGDCEDDIVEETADPFEQIEVSEGQGIEGSGIDDDTG